MSEKRKHLDPFYLRVRIDRNGDKITVGCLPVRFKHSEIDYGEIFTDFPGLHGLHTDGMMYLNDPGVHINWHGIDQFFYDDIYRVYGPGAVMMAKALTRYNKALVAVHDKLGYPESMGRAVQWAVIALGAAGIVIENEPSIPEVFVNGNVASEINRRITLLQGDKNHG